MWRYRTHHWNRHPYHFRRGNPLMLILPILFLVFFGGFIFKMLLWLIPVLLIAWGVSKLLGMNSHAHGPHNNLDIGAKLKMEDYEDEKRKREYVQAEDGQWVEII